MQDPEPPAILYAAADLIWATRLKAAAEDLGIPARPVRTIAMLNDRLADTQTAAIVVDLQADNAIAILEAAAGARADSGGQLRIVAFGPHEDREALGAARSAGADDVLTRGAMHSRLAAILADLAG